MSTRSSFLSNPAKYQLKRFLESIVLSNRSSTRTMNVSNPCMKRMYQTRILPVDISEVDDLRNLTETRYHALSADSKTQSRQNLLIAAEALRETIVPVAFPTETVYGLGANATSREAVRAIFTAKQRPADNPLIVHVSSLSQLRSLLMPACNRTDSPDPLPSLYLPLIERFWPGPLSILLPNPPDSKLAPEVTASQATFAARMPSSKLALALIEMSGVPLAAPSANASTRPSPTTANHVYHDLNGRIEYIVDGGSCDVGVESTVVDGLSDPPAILRPGGVGLEEIRKVPGWERCQIGYQNKVNFLESSEAGSAAEGCVPRAPGMKYRHYSPRARVILVNCPGPSGENFVARLLSKKLEEFSKSFSTRPGSADESDVRAGQLRVGIIRTKTWQQTILPSTTTDSSKVKMDRYHSPKREQDIKDCGCKIFDLSIGPDTAEIARRLFSALRELDEKAADIIFVEGIDNNHPSGKDAEAFRERFLNGDHQPGEEATSAAIINRLSKAAEEVYSQVEM